MKIDKTRRKSVYHRKHHIENILNQINEKHDTEISYKKKQTKDWFKLFDQVLPQVNETTKRMISINYKLRKLFEVLGLPYENIKPGWNIIINDGIMCMDYLRMTFTKLSTSDLLCDSLKAWSLKVIQRDFPYEWVERKVCECFHHCVTFLEKEEVDESSNWYNCVL